MNQRILMVLTILGMLVALMNLDGRLITFTNAAPQPTEKFCFGTGPDPFEDVSCHKGLGTCQKAEDDFIANGGTVFGSCHNVFKHIKP